MDGKKFKFSETALVIIDLQKGIAASGAETKPNKTSTVIANAARLAAKFREQKAPVFLVHVSSIDGKDMLNPVVDNTPNWGGARPADWDAFVPELNAQRNDIIITKRHWGAFHGTELDLQLRRRGIRNIVLCGIATNMGVESTAREAYQYGYNQIFAEDAMGAMSNEEHDATVKNIFPRIGLVRKTNEALAMLS
ncbi:hydrolase [Candidatus Marsarchaeota archaeon]|nr:hydrolase [Candidatus Marsarchaeota archaeon]MCL5404743.1 hydrolase [Candidatus Marsarchaeota archaeon]